ncbi:acyl-CoA synthetase family member 2, mitochondrial isoform X1 [Lingula anatina]|uniref:Medium-chain acyl-CoA ligase ACSF2, mitochondrial n=1 Tax=Lingula anatina TaxID=7574 RepID=A0A1S3JUN5_LINAN|nr:acyl-CoA synthetase family member 2, mitochondrial isoform X1 [Lingula anatina]|eukprot:XP_013413811.1 acyl-CoA synthetase family member 2, mitochondrial isoform X1 [Lingula anatina]
MTRRLLIKYSRNLGWFVNNRYAQSRRHLSTDSVHEKTGKLDWSYVHGPAERPLIGKTIGRLLDETSDRCGDRTAYVFCRDGIRKNFTEFRNEVDRLAAGFLALGLKPGDRVGMWGPNTEEWVLTQYATARVGIILVNINPAYQAKELEFALRKVGCKAIVAASEFKTQDYYQMLFHINHELAFCKPGQLKNPHLPELSIVIMLGKKKFPGTFAFDDVLSMGGSDEEKELQRLQNKLQFDQPINIQFTSGTTGQPKGATLTHHNIVNNAYFVGLRMDYHRRDTRICISPPLYHCFGMVLGSLMSLVHGATLIFPSPSFEPEAALKAVHDEKCTALYGTPTMFIDMLNHQNFSSYHLGSLYTGIMAGSPCPSVIMKQVVINMHMKHLTVCYGTTENSPVTLQSFMESPFEKRVSSVGKASAHVELKVVNSEGDIVPVNTVGELCTRGYATMLGYWGDEDRTREVVKPDGWYHTGDLAFLDEEGYGHITGRLKDMVIRGGENIYPLEVEEFLYTYPKIEDVQVIGVPDERLGEELCAWVRLHKGETATQEEIKEFCKGKISHFKIPKYIMFVDSFPLTVTGKVQKFKMREQSTKELHLDHVIPH